MVVKDNRNEGDIIEVKMGGTIESIRDVPRLSADQGAFLRLCPPWSVHSVSLWCLLMVFNGIEVRFLMALVQWCSRFLFSSGGEFHFLGRRSTQSFHSAYTCANVSPLQNTFICDC